MAPTFASLDCRLNALVARVWSSTDIPRRRAYLASRLTKAQRRMTNAERLCRISHAKAARDRLERVIHALTRFGRGLRWERGRRFMPAALRVELTVAEQGIRDSLHTLRRTLQCPNAALGG